MDAGTSGERRGRVIKQSQGPDREAIGRAHTNPLFDTSEYDIKFTDGAIDRYMVNVIAENMFAQVDEEGNMTFEGQTQAYVCGIELRTCDRQ